MLRSPLFLAFLLAFGLSYFVPYHEVDSKAQPLYYSVFTMMHDTCPKIKEPLQLIVRYDSLEDKDWIGVCKITGLARREIVLDSSYWNSASFEDKFSLMAHEMTHCLLDMDHSLDEHNYMYYADRPSVLEETKAQLLVNIKEYCNVR